jgi:predicted site-specific integrase-resolvase
MDTEKTKTSIDTEKTKAPPEPLMSRMDVANLFGIHWNTVARWQRRGLLPPPIRVGFKYHYKAADIEAMLERHASAPLK